jgi:hypothetical protein
MPRPPTTTRLCVESCLQLWIKRLAAGAGTVTWSTESTGSESAETEPLARLHYERAPAAVHIPAQVISLRPAPRSLALHHIPLLETTQPDNPAQQQWFLCTCNRRVAKLYLPPARDQFRCRHCYNLSYRSRQQWDGRVAYLARHPEELVRALASPSLSRQLLALQAALRQETQARAGETARTARTARTAG